MMYSLPVERHIDTDVLVVGGGTAGTFAAICAARSGAKTLLMEKGSMLGGTMTACSVSFPGLFFAWGKQIISGPCWEAVQRVDALGGAEIPEQVRLPARHWHLQIRLNEFDLAAVLDEMCAECGVAVHFHTMLVEASEKEDGVLALFAQKDGPLTVKARVLIDATGDANAVSSMGFAVRKSEILQPATLINTLAGYRLEDVSENDVNAVFRQAFADGEVFRRDFQGSTPMSILKMHKFHMHVHTAAPETSDGKSQLETEARAVCMRLLKVFRRVKGLEKLYVASFASECGVRESVRIVGKAEISAQDYIRGRVYPDAICYAFYPIDRHTDSGIHQVFHEEDVVATIPYSALVPADSRYVLAAGRCISADTDANSGLRVEAPCMASGQAAGVAAALMAETGSTSEIDVGTLKQRLRALGAIVP